ncbi:MAG: hypothetical protein ACRD2L_21605 [Terriglobia bacterium]
MMPDRIYKINRMTSETDMEELRLAFKLIRHIGSVQIAPLAFAL